MYFVLPGKHGTGIFIGRHLGITFYCRASICYTFPSHLFQHTFFVIISYYFFSTLLTLDGIRLTLKINQSAERLNWNFRQMFISICVIDTQNGDLCIACNYSLLVKLLIEIRSLDFFITDHKDDSLNYIN